MKREKRITVYSYAKINLSLDVTGLTEDGFHEVEMIMQGLYLHDDVFMRWIPQEEKKGISIELKTDLVYVPDDERNIAYKAAQLMAAENPDKGGRLIIKIHKRIPVGAGLAGGSGNGAAVLMGLSYLWDLDISLKELMEKGEKLGSDVPFSLALQAACNRAFGYSKDRMAATCAVARGRGTVLEPIKAADFNVMLCTFPFSVSTAEVYRGIDSCEIPERPDNEALRKAIEESSQVRMKENMINVLENYTLYRYDKICDAKNCITKNAQIGQPVLMTGSGPTLFVLCPDRESASELADRVKRELKDKGIRFVLTRTVL